MGYGNNLGMFVFQLGWVVWQMEWMALCDYITENKTPSQQAIARDSSAGLEEASWCTICGEGHMAGNHRLHVDAESLRVITKKKLTSSNNHMNLEEDLEPQMGLQSLWTLSL